MNDNTQSKNPVSPQIGASETYLTLKEAVRVLSEYNIHTDTSQLLRAASPDAYGVKRLPFWKEPITGYYMISKASLLDHYKRLQTLALDNVLDWLEEEQR